MSESSQGEARPVVQPIPVWLSAPSTSAVDPPKITSPQLLPLEQLAWEDFERLCLRLVRLDGEPEHVQLYGDRGQEQAGIDIYARARDTSRTVYQCKRVEAMTPARIRAAVDRFMDGVWADRAGGLVVCTSDRTVRTERAEVIEEQFNRLNRRGKWFVVWDAEAISTRLKDEPTIVWDFFGSAWVEVFCAPGAHWPSKTRLDVAAVARYRERLRDFYERLFSISDAADTLLAADQMASAPLIERFVMPDITQRVRLTPPRLAGSRDSQAPMSDRHDSSSERATAGDVAQRMDAASWLAREPRAVVVGGAGSGKSTLLRYIVLDALAAEPTTTPVHVSGTTHLPVWVPFAFWVAAIADGERELSLTEALRRWFDAFDESGLFDLVQEALEDERLLLIVDGLDEFADEVAATSAFDRLQLFVAGRALPVLAGGRRESVSRIGPVPRDWSIAELAALSGAQRRALVAQMPALTPGGAAADSELFLQDLERARDLRELAGAPLLTVVLWWLFAREARLPRDRFEAYTTLTNELLAGHPARRRRAAGVPSARPALAAEDMRAALAATAFWLHSEGGVLGRVHLQARLQVFFADDERGIGIGLTPPQARTLARDVIDQAIRDLGILIAVGHDDVAFVHRALQEHLAAEHVGSWSSDDRAKLLAADPGVPLWSEVTLAVLASLEEEAEADLLLYALRDAAGSRATRWQLAPLLAEVAVGSFSCSSKVREWLLAEALEIVERCPWMPAREQVLDRLIDGLDAPTVGSELRTRTRRWLPCRAHSREGLVRTMESWPSEPDTEEVLWQALVDEQVPTARAAALMLARRHADDSHRADRLIGLLGQPIAASTRAAALEALLWGWPDHPTLERLMSRARGSVDPDLRMVAHEYRVARAVQDEEDLADVLRLGRQWTGVDYHRRHEVAGLLLRGWPGNERVKSICLGTSRRQTSTRELEFAIALHVLLVGYATDPEVISFCVEQVRHDEHPFLMLHLDAWKLLAEHFRDQPALVEALDEWMPAQQFRDAEVAFAALVGRTSVGKRVLIANLSDPGTFVHWPVYALLRGWGMQDEETADALRTAAKDEPAMAGVIAGSLPEILDQAELGSRLLELLADPSNPRPSRALPPLAKNTDSETRAQAVGIALERVGDSKGFGDEIADGLYLHFAEDARVQELAREWRAEREPNLTALGVVAAHDSHLRRGLREAACPLPAALRTRLAEALHAGAASDDAASEVVGEFWGEYDDQAAATAASAFTRRCRDADKRAEVLAEATERIGYRGFLHEAAQHAATAVLLELGRLDVLANARERHDPDKPLNVALTRGLDPNWWLASQIVEHFEHVEEALGAGFAKRFAQFDDVASVWESIAPFAANRAGAREACLEFVRSAPRALGAQLLDFLASVRPASSELLDHCRAAAGIDIADRSGLRDACVRAVELLAEHFGGDLDVAKVLLGDGPPRAGALAALALGWRQTPALAEAASRYNEDPRREGIPRDLHVRIELALAAPAAALAVLEAELRLIEGGPGMTLPASELAARRTAGDSEFRRLLLEEARNQSNLALRANGPRLLSAAGRLDTGGRDALRAQLERSLGGDEVDLITADLLSGERRPLGLVQLDALRAAGQD